MSAEPGTSSSLTEGEPSVLGAAQSLPDQGARDRRRARREHRRRGGRTRSPLTNSDSTTPLPGYSGIEYVFEPHGVNMVPLRAYVRSLWERRQFMVALARSDNRKQRSNAALGVLWTVLDPLFQALVYFMLYTIIRRSSDPEFLPAIVGGFFLFSRALSSVMDGGRSLSQSRSMMLNSTFPRALFPLTTVCRNILTMPAAIGVWAVFQLVFGATLGWGALLLPVLFALQIPIMIGLSLLMSTLIVSFKDAENAVQYATRVLFFVTPVIYPVTMLSERAQAALSFQPFFTLFASYQTIFMGGTPSAWQVTQVVLWAVGLLTAGQWVFRRHEHEFASKL